MTRSLPSRTLALLGVAPLALLALVACAPIERHEEPLRVLVFNIHAGKDAKGRGNLDEVAALVRSTGADVVLLQEVDRETRRSGGIDQLNVLSGATRFDGAFGKSLDYDGGEYGIAALSRTRFSASETHPLPTSPPQPRAGGATEPRVAHSARTRTAIGDVLVVNTHLDASREDEYRLQEAQHLLTIVGERRAGSAPVLIGGDFNAEPGSRVLDTLRGAGLRDAWAECGRGDGLTYPSDRPVKRIDYLFLTGTLGCTSARVIETTISDHRPLLVTVVQK